MSIKVYFDAQDIINKLKESNVYCESCNSFQTEDCPLGLIEEILFCSEWKNIKPKPKPNERINEWPGS